MTGEGGSGAGRREAGRDVRGKANCWVGGNGWVGLIIFYMD